MNGFVIFSIFWEKLPPRGVSTIFRFTSSKISGAISSLFFHGVASPISPKHFSINLVALFLSRHLYLQLSTGPNVESSANHSDVWICQSMGVVPGNWCNHWPMSHDRHCYSYSTTCSNCSAPSPDSSKNPDKEPPVGMGGLRFMLGIVRWHLLPFPQKD